MVIVVFTVASILVLVFTIYLLYFLHSYSIDSICRTAKTGDIVYFRWEKMPIEMNYVTPFTHVGMVLVDPKDDKRYILETHSARDLQYLGINTSGINIYPLRMRIETYQGRIYYSRLKSALHLDVIRFVDFMAKVAVYKMTIPFYEEYKAYYLQNCIVNNMHNKVGLYCSEFVGLCLKDLGVLQKDFRHECLLPHDFLTIVDQSGEYLYDDLVSINTV